MEEGEKEMNWLSKWLNKLGCNHKWTCFREQPVNSDLYGHYTIWSFYCSKCGKFKKVHNR